MKVPRYKPGDRVRVVKSKWPEIDGKHGTVEFERVGYPRYVRVRIDNVVRPGSESNVWYMIREEIELV